jgi:hypothetical protein
MDILAGMLAYMAGLAALFGALTVSFFVFFATPKEQAQSQPQNASAMLMRPSAPKKQATIEARAKQSAKQTGSHAERYATAAGTPGSAQRTASAGESRRKHTKTAAQARRPIEEERARRWAYQQDGGQEESQGGSFEKRFLGYAD